jgi:hypothetical protein
MISVGLGVSPKGRTLTQVGELGQCHGDPTGKMGNEEDIMAIKLRQQDDVRGYIVN